MNADKASQLDQHPGSAEPAYANDAAMKDYKAKVKQYQPDADVDNGIVAYGWTQGALMVETLKGLDTLPGRDERTPVDGQGRGRPAAPRRLGHDDGDEDPFMGETLQTVQYDAAAEALQQHR